MTDQQEHTSNDHIGWDLWRATGVWKQAFTRQMVSHGHGWYAEARGAVFRFIGTDGIAQIELAAQAGISKQAVQQHLDDLGRDGVIIRQPVPGDGRKKRIMLTKTGRKAMRDSEMIKLAIEADYRQLIGERDLETLKLALSRIIASLDHQGIDGSS